MAGFIQCHGEVESVAMQFPFGNRTRVPVDSQDYVAAIGVVHKHSRPGLLKLEGLRMTAARLVVAADLLVRHGVDNANGPAFVLTISYVNPSRCGVVANVVGILAEIDGLDQFERGAVVDPDLAVACIGYDDAIILGNVDDALRFFRSS